MLGGLSDVDELVAFWLRALHLELGYDAEEDDGCGASASAHM
jgi:hypothetical protein